MREHNEINPIEVERLKKILDDKEVTLVERVEEVKWWVRKEANTQAQLKAASELFL